MLSNFSGDMLVAKELCSELLLTGIVSWHLGRLK